MFSTSRQKSPIRFAAGGAALAAASIATLSLFPRAGFAGFALAGLAWLLFWVSRFTTNPASRREIWLRTPLDWPILLLLIQIGLSYWVSAQPEKTFIVTAQLAAGLVACFAIVNWSLDRTRLWWAVAALIALGLALALVAPFAVDWLSDRKTFLPPILLEFFPLLLSDSIHHNVMASALVTLLPLPLALFLALSPGPGLRFWLRTALLVISLIGIVIVILTQSRGGYIALGLSLWLTLWLSGRRRWAIALTIVAVLVIIWLTTRPLAEAVEGLDATQVALDPSTWSFRQRVWQTAINIIGDYAFSGVGAGTFNDVAILFYGFDSHNNPGAHNLFLQAGVDLGIPGLISFLSVLLLAIWTAIRSYRHYGLPHETRMRAIAIGGLAGLVATVAHGLVDSHTWGSKGAFIPWTVIGLVIALYSLAIQSPQGPGEHGESASSRR
jgi:putative inorganic carbon (HCO3(-)) transporter